MAVDMAASLAEKAPVPLREFNTLSLAIEGYPDRLSFRPGEEATFHCSSRRPTFSVEIARIGVNREVVHSRAGIAGSERPVPADAYATGCSWPATFSLVIPEEWRSGFYEVAFRADDRQQSRHVMRQGSWFLHDGSECSRGPQRRVDSDEVNSHSDRACDSCSPLSMQPTDAGRCARRSDERPEKKTLPQLHHSAARHRLREFGRKNLEHA